MFNAKVLALRTGLKVMEGSGLVSLFRQRMQGIGSILCLHRVCPGGGLQDGFAPNSKLEITPEFLRGLIQLVRSRGFETVSMAVMVERLKSGEAGGKPMAVFTLDDGYRDNFEHAKPVFDELNCPYTIYVAPAIADGTCNLWWNTVEQIVALSDQLKFTMAGRDFDLPCRSVAEKNKAFSAIFMHFYFIDQHEQRRLLDTLAAQHKVDPQAYCRGEAMGWDELREIAKDPLCTIGAHTINHYAVAELKADEALSEMQGSRIRIEQEIDRNVAFFAYPYGDAPAAGPRDFELAARAGFTSSVTTRKGVIWPSDVAHMQSLPRIMVSGRYQDLAMVDALISGLPTGLLNKIKPIHSA